MRIDSTPHASAIGLSDDAANQAGSFSFSPVKPALSLERQVELLRGRGLTVGDDDKAVRWLSETNYYRIRGYWMTFERDGGFVPGTTLDDIMEVYRLDVGLRLWLWAAIGPVEVKTRTAMAYHLGRACGPLSYNDPTCFADTKAHRRSMTSFRTERDRALRDGVPCVVHNMAKYGCLPIWAAVEIMSMGTVSRLYGNLSDTAAYDDGTTVRKTIADEFGVKPYHLKSWLQHLTYIRNLCGHHSRIYNRTMTTRATLLKADNRYNGPKTFPTMLVLQRVYERVWPERWPSMAKDLAALIDSHPSVDLTPLGFPADWAVILHADNDARTTE